MKLKKKVVVFLIIILIVIGGSFFVYIERDNIFKNINDIKDKIKEEAYNITEFSIKNEKIYLALTGTETIEYALKEEKDREVEVSFTSEDESIATVDENGKVVGIADGETNIIVKALDKSLSVQVYVTKLITTMPDKFDFDKKFLTCNQYTKEENDFLDEILAARVEAAGKNTRAGVVAAARFLGLEFPYRIGYFSENGRLNGYNVHPFADGEGRYYHVGLYLNESRYENITSAYANNGPGTWGCKIYSDPSGHKVANGFDCSGFITWILVQGGYDPGDVGAGITYLPDMTDLGTKNILTKAVANGTIRAGDLLSGKGETGGHIALVAGIDEEHYYVAESLWVGTGYFGALIQTYQKDKLKNNFYWHIDMNEYYGEDGNYTEYWK